MKLIIALLFLFLLALQIRLWSGQGSYANMAQLNREIAEQETENERLSQRNQTLYAEVNDLKSGLDAIEERARNELGMIKEGETFYLIVDEE